MPPLKIDDDRETSLLVAAAASALLWVAGIVLVVFLARLLGGC
jgi:hypothetical protein